MYNYQSQRNNLFAEKGQRLFLAVRDSVNKLLEISGAVMSHKIKAKGIGAYDSWDFIACLDRMVELGEIEEITSPNTWGQFKVYVRCK